MSDLKFKKKQQIYNRWHREIYQLDIKEDIKQFKMINQFAIQYLDINKNTEGKLLDIACGKGLLLRSIREMNKKMELYGSDISDYAISSDKRIINAKFSVDDGENLSFKDSQFDFVTCIGGLEYFENPANGAREIARVLKKDGKAVIFVPNLMFIGYTTLFFTERSPSTWFILLFLFARKMLKRVADKIIFSDYFFNSFFVAYFGPPA